MVIRTNFNTDWLPTTSIPSPTLPCFLYFAECNLISQLTSEYMMEKRSLAQNCVRCIFTPTWPWRWLIRQNKEDLFFLILGFKNALLSLSVRLHESFLLDFEVTEYWACLERELEIGHLFCSVGLSSSSVRCIRETLHNILLPSYVYRHTLLLQTENEKHLSYMFQGCQNDSGFYRAQVITEGAGSICLALNS